MAKQQTQKVKGCKKCGRSKKRSAAKGNAISLFVRDKISAKEYWAMVGISTKV